MSIDYKELGNKEFFAKNYDEAVNYFSKGIELEPSNYILYSNRSAVFICQEKFQEALEDAVKCVQLNPDWPKGYSRKGCAEYKLKKYKEAVESYKKALELDPTNNSIQSALQQAEEASQPSKNFHMQTVIDELVEVTLKKPKFMKYTEEDPDYPNRLKEALQGLYKDPQNFNFAMAYNRDIRVQEGLKDILHISMPETDDFEKPSKPETKSSQKPTQDEPKSPEKPQTPEQIEAEALKSKGNELYKQKKFAEALELYDQAISIYPQNVLYHTNKAAVYLEMGEYDLCINECEKVINKRYDVHAPFEHVAKAYVRMASCYRKMENYDLAIEMYQKALTEDNNRHTRAALNETKTLREKKMKEQYINPELAEEHRLKGNEYFKNGQYPEAKKEYDEAIKRNPADARLFANRSAALMKLLELPMALADVEKSLDLDSKKAKVWARKGNIHMMMKEYNKALSAFMKGLEEDKNNFECARGLDEVSRKIQDSSRSDQIDEEQVKRAMADPEIQTILSDPQIALILKGISEDPTKLQSAMKDPRIAISIQKLMAAGILKLK